MVMRRRHRGCERVGETHGMAQLPGAGLAALGMEPEAIAVDHQGDRILGQGNRILSCPGEPPGAEWRRPDSWNLAPARATLLYW